MQTSHSRDIDCQSGHDDPDREPAELIEAQISESGIPLEKLDDQIIIHTFPQDPSPATLTNLMSFPFSSPLTFLRNWTKWKDGRRKHQSVYRPTSGKHGIWQVWYQSFVAPWTSLGRDKTGIRQSIWYIFFILMLYQWSLQCLNFLPHAAQISNL